MTASAWRSIYDSQEQVIITSTGTHIRRPASGCFAGFVRGGAFSGTLVAIRAIHFQEGRSKRVASAPLALLGSLSDRCVNVAGLDIEHLQEWVGRTETRSDQVTPAPVAALAATLDIEG